MQNQRSMVSKRVNRLRKIVLMTGHTWPRSYLAECEALEAKRGVASRGEQSTQFGQGRSR